MFRDTDKDAPGHSTRRRESGQAGHTIHTAYLAHSLPFRERRTCGGEVADVASYPCIAPLGANQHYSALVEKRDSSFLRQVRWDEQGAELIQRRGCRDNTSR